jgi:hypothetical protein
MPQQLRVESDSMMTKVKRHEIGHLVVNAHPFTCQRANDHEQQGQKKDIHSGPENQRKPGDILLFSFWSSSREHERPIQGRRANCDPRPRATLAGLALPWALGTNPSGSKSGRSARWLSGLKGRFCQPEAPRALGAATWDFPAGARVSTETLTRCMSRFLVPAEIGRRAAGRCEYCRID